MGAEIRCAVTVNGKQATARARLETNVLQIRGRDLKLDVPFGEMKGVAARKGILAIGYNSQRLTLALGDSAERWAEKILHPPSRVAKLGIRTDVRVAILGTVETTFVDELREAGAVVSMGRLVKDADAVFIALARPFDFERIAAVKSSIKPAGAVWLIREKGHAQVTELAVMAAGKAAGLVDVKVVGFSATHSAMKFVIPLKARPRQS